MIAVILQNYLESHTIIQGVIINYLIKYLINSFTLDYREIL